MTKVKKRFVAGAKCPKCGAVDSILLFKQHNIETVECTDCDYTEQQNEQAVTQKASGDMIGVFKPD
ncbi:YheV family putative zinc ribbon protein [Shewanella gaetbuli]|uniref:YheV family putative metal-binding protein n=1 Tax=Shewanella gaetbuli TaxID=220752 RepID=A0A9X1ZQM1_9GAMM|nr:YheV family putative zinc ribbon protein [Shewanella gaetbuli]MCL1142273.1 YheV family putative metal-binding protein [Shewanella gaetbuli]